MPHHRKTDLRCIQGIRKCKRVFFHTWEVYLLDATRGFMEKGYTLSEIRKALEGFDTRTREVREGVNEEVVTVGRCSHGTLPIDSVENRKGNTDEKSDA